MLDLRVIREAPDRVRAALERRGKPEALAALEEVLALAEQRGALIAQVDALRAERNEVSPQVGRLKTKGRHEEAEPLIVRMREVGERMGALEGELTQIETRVRDLLLNIPNLPEAAVPPGGEDANVVVREWGPEPSFDFQPRPHWELGEDLGILDLPRGTKITGSGFPVYVGAGARIERALISLMLDMHTREHGYTELSPPLLVNETSALGTGHLPKYADDMYFVTEDRLYLVPTAEVPVTNLHAGEVLEPDALPKRYVAYTPCFRREAGSHGKDTRGILRVHQFDKVELMRFERAEASRAALEELTAHAEAVLQRLGLRYRVLLLAGGDLGFANAQTYDLEVWAPGVQRWLEVSSCSLYNDYQARRANIRYRPALGARPEFAHTLNGSGTGLPRTLIAVLESGQQADGSIQLPPALAEYARMERITR
ncbi:MAG TPA: serine--tRNA ligase [Longimicrobiales bacterium]|nr:serine--tRNA ligase [Longimicrobiales bacterium]